MKLKRDTKSGEKLTHRFKIDIRNLTRALKSLKNSHFSGLRLSKVYIVLTKNV